MITHFFYRQGLYGHIGEVETTVEPGLGIHIVGLPDTEAREVLLQVVTAMLSCGYHIPGKRITITVTGFGNYSREVCLGIAVSIIEATGQGTSRFPGAFYCGELGLDGSVRDYSAGLSRCAIKGRDPISPWATCLCAWASLSPVVYPNESGEGSDDVRENFIPIKHLKDVFVAPRPRDLFD